MKVVSFNINSIRARPHQLIHLRDTHDPSSLRGVKSNQQHHKIDLSLN